jgi:hypothetical protein
MKEWAALCKLTQSNFIPLSKYSDVIGRRLRGAVRFHRVLREYALLASLQAKLRKA